MKRLLINLFLLTLFSIQIAAQGIQQTFVISDLNPYLSAYVSPFAKAMAVSMSGGWTHTAKVHNLLGFDLTLGASYVQIPTSEMTFNPQKIDMPGYSFIGKEAPTISSDENMPLTLITKEFINGAPFGFSIPVLKGLNISYGGMVNLQAAIGLPKGTDLIVRYIPDVSSTTNRLITEGIELRKTGVFGMGVKHDIKQWLPFIKEVPFLQLSGLASYSRFFTGFYGDAMRVDPEAMGIDSDLRETLWDGQQLDIKMSSFMGSLLLGADFPVFQPFIGIGVNSSTFEGDFVGNYPIVKFNLLNPLGVIDDYEVDPIHTSVTSMDFNFQAGARLKLGFFVLYYALTFQQYTMHSAGMSITFN